MSVRNYYFHQPIPTFFSLFFSSFNTTMKIITKPLMVLFQTFSSLCLYSLYWGGIVQFGGQIVFDSHNQLTDQDITDSFLENEEKVASANRVSIKLSYQMEKAKDCGKLARILCGNKLSASRLGWMNWADVHYGCLTYLGMMSHRLPSLIIFRHGLFTFFLAYLNPLMHCVCWILLCDAHWWCLIVSSFKAMILSW